MMDDQAKQHLAQVEFNKQVKAAREEDTKQLEDEKALNSLMARTRKHPVHHTLIRSEETPKMALVLKQIAALQAEYDKLREQEQRNEFAAFLRLFRQKFNRPLD